MAKLGLIFLCIAAGMLFRHFKVFPESAATILNRFVIWVSLPAMVLYYIHSIDLSTSDTSALFAAAFMPWLLFFGAWGFIAVIGKLRCWDRRTIGALVLTSGLGNTSFVGFAMIDAFYGAKGLQTAVLIDQLGSFLVLSTLGIMVAIFYSGKTLSLKDIGKKLVAFPPFFALFAAFALMPFTFPQEVDEILLMLSGTLVPLTMISVGLQLNISLAALRRHKGHLAAGLGYKLAIAPACIYALYGLFMSPEDVVFRVIVLEAAMASMVTGGIVAAEYDLRGELAALMVGISIAISLVTVPLMNMFIW